MVYRTFTYTNTHDVKYITQIDDFSEMSNFNKQVSYVVREG